MNALALGKRRSAVFSMQRSTTASSAGEHGRGLARPRRRRLEVLALDVGHRLGAERILSREQVVEHDARARRRRCADRSASPRICSGAIVYEVPSRVPTTVRPPSPASGRISLAMPKSSSLTTRLSPDGADEDVAGLEIAVDDALVVRRLQRRADRLEDLQHLAGREAAALGQDRPQVDPLEQLHDVERTPVGERRRTRRCRRCSGA